ncbi:MAG TPA: hypothetical protein VF070_48225 [Streptosporangiaceae bacterium]
MNPEILRMIAKQQVQDAQARADRRRMARTLRFGRRHAAEIGDFAVPPIPDYVDGSFRTDQVASEVPAARTAA